MQFEKRVYRHFNRNSYHSFVLGGDIGGTNTNLGIFGIKGDSFVLLASLHFKSRELRGLHPAINTALDYAKEDYGISIGKSCLAVAGVISSKKDYVRTQNVPWNISKNELLKKTKLKQIMLINDFEAVGYAINMLAPKDVAVARKAPKIPKAPVLVIGAGTGLGKTMLVYNEQCGFYTPIPSEAGHMDFSAQSRQELDLVDFIKKYKRVDEVSFEMVLSGNGLSSIYSFLRKNGRFAETEYAKEIAKSRNDPLLISKYRKSDKTCRAAFDIFRAIYAKFARSMALDCMAFGGVYIAGGIAAKNKDIFGKNFAKDFEKNYKLAHMLKKIPIYVILNSNAGLIGAGFAGAKFL